MSRIAEEMEKACEEGVFPGAALLVARGNDILLRSFFGSASLTPEKEPVTESTIFDIASLTKPVAAASLILMAIKEKGLPLNAPVVRYLPDFSDEDKKKITIRHLLKHTSGLPAWKPYFSEIEKEHPEIVGKRESRSQYIAKIASESLEMPVSYQRLYSDLGFILLGIFLENFLGGTLDLLFQETVARPLEMTGTFYVPVGAESLRSRSLFAATQESPWRKRLLRGEVDDDNAYALGGVAGHAGLFSNVDDLHRFLRHIEISHEHENSFFGREYLQEFIGPKVKVKLGWDTPDPANSQAGKYFSKNSIGHLGFTGCSFWADLDQGFHVILLTNRVHPTAGNDKIKEFRPKIHDTIYEELIRS